MKLHVFDMEKLPKNPPQIVFFSSWYIKRFKTGFSSCLYFVELIKDIFQDDFEHLVMLFIKQDPKNCVYQCNNSAPNNIFFEQGESLC